LSGIDKPSATVSLVVDELAVVRLGLTTLLRTLAVDPKVVVAAEAAGGREGAELAQLHGANLIVIGTPADMPVFEAVRRARAVSETVTIVALLGAGQLESVAAVVGAGATGVTRRGASPDELLVAFATVLAGERYVATTLSPGLVGTLEPAEPPGPGAATRDLLTYREREVLALLASGATNREIAATLSVTVATVKTHLVHLYTKLEVRSRQEALSRAVGLGLLS
jgi:DNA-binding NarL/FixJ family response regulator